MKNVILMYFYSYIHAECNIYYGTITIGQHSQWDAHIIHKEAQCLCRGLLQFMLIFLHIQPTAATIS